MLGVELVLTGGSKLGGWASAELPEHHARLLDLLNASRDPFFAVWTHAGHPLRQPHVRAVRGATELAHARADRPFVDVLLREQGDQLYLLPDEAGHHGEGRQAPESEPASRSPISTLRSARRGGAVRVGQPHRSDDRDGVEYIADRGMVRVADRADMGRLTAMVAPSGIPGGRGPRRKRPPLRQRSGRPPTVTRGPPPHLRHARRSRPRLPRHPWSRRRAPPPQHRPRPRACPPTSPRSTRGPNGPWGELLKALVRRPSSDLHLRVGEPPVFRTHGEMKRQATPPLHIRQLEVMLLSVMPERQPRGMEGDGRLRLRVRDRRAARFRVERGARSQGPMAVFPRDPGQGRERRAARDLEGGAAALLLNEGSRARPGPTGSGKSTTLCSLIDLINRTRTDHIITIEDPIEFVHENKKCVITQRQVGVHTDTFKRALRSALREDPDIVLVGEMRDLETIAIAIGDRRDRPPRVRYAAHDDGRLHRRPHDRSVSGGPAVTDSGDVVGVAEGVIATDAVQRSWAADAWRRGRYCSRRPAIFEPHPRRKDVSRSPRSSRPRRRSACSR